MNMMRKNNNRGGGNRQRSGGGGQRRYNNNGGGGGNRGGQNDGQNLQRQKHHATQQREKFSNMARDAQNNGDRVDVEYYLQHVDHYNRILNDIAAIEAERFAHQREAQIIPGGPNDPNAQQNAGGDNASSGGDTASETQGDNAAAAANDAASGGSGDTDFSSNQPRMTRQQRPQPASDNGAREANRNGDDIPLPGSILPPI